MFPGRRYDELTGPEMRTGVVGALNTSETKRGGHKWLVCSRGSCCVVVAASDQVAACGLMSETKQDDIPRKMVARVGKTDNCEAV